MYNTYKIISRLIKPELSALDYPALIRLYRETESTKEKNIYYANIFCKLFLMAYGIQDKFTTLTNEQRVEECVLCLLVCLDKYNLNKNIKFSTYFYTAYTNKLKTLVTNANCEKRRVWKELIDVNTNTLNYLLNNIVDESLNIEAQLFEIKHNDLLNDEEKLYCSCAVKGCKSAKQFIDMMHYDTSYLLDKNSKNVSYPSTDFLRRKLRKLKKGIQNKFIENDNLF